MSAATIVTQKHKIEITKCSLKNVVFANRQKQKNAAFTAANRIAVCHICGYTPIWVKRLLAASPSAIAFIGMTKKGRTAFFRYTSVKISIITNTPTATPTPIHLDVLNSDVTCKQTKNRNVVSANPPRVSAHFLVIIFLL